MISALYFYNIIISNTVVIDKRKEYLLKAPISEEKNFFLILNESALPYTYV